MVVSEEEPLARLLMLKSQPLRSTGSVPLSRLVNRNLARTVVQQIPNRLAVGDANLTPSFEGLIFIQQAHGIQQQLFVFALLESHHIVWPSAFDQIASAVLFTMMDTLVQIE
jgi:hypothetical protein